jgi:hypothetical protein
LDQDRAFDCSDDGRKFQQHPVAGRLDEPSAKGAHDPRRRIATLAHEPRRTGLVLAHEPRIAGHVGGEDGGKFPGLGHAGPSVSGRLAQSPRFSPPKSERRRSSNTYKLRILKYKRKGGGRTDSFWRLAL